MLKKNGTAQRTTIFAGSYEKVTEGGVTRQLYYLHGADGLAAVYVKQAGQAGQADTIYYAHTDHLGSIVKLTNASGTEVFKASYDAWGKQTVTNSAFKFHRGYTGHEHLPEFGLVNMNGRMYDPLLGRMLSPDPYVPDPYFSQDYNRYSYARNNPLVYTDPDGESILIASIIIGAIVGAYIGGSAANNTLDPTMWEWDSKDTWIGMGIGGVVGAVAVGGLRRRRLLWRAPLSFPTLGPAVRLPRMVWWVLPPAAR